VQGDSRLVRTAFLPLLITTLLLIGAIAGCAGSGRLPAVPNEATGRAKPLGMTNARFRADTDGPAMVWEAVAAARASSLPDRQDASEFRAPASYLAVSGDLRQWRVRRELLVGWTESGTRPGFKLDRDQHRRSDSTVRLPRPVIRPAVAGVAGRDTMASPDDIYEERWLPTAVFGDALAGTDPLFRLISRYAEAASC